MDPAPQAAKPASSKKGPPPAESQTIAATPPRKGVYLWAPFSPLPDSQGMQIGLTSGETFIIPHDRAGVLVPRKFQREAIAHGCLPVGMEPEEETEGEGFNREQVIRDGITKMLDSTDENAFQADGFPNLNVLARTVGFTPSRMEVQRIFKAMQAGGDGDDGESVSNISD